ncbi:MAG TPA: MASE1 domain-containing protein, partial [Terriglobia bacterium]|nr:MASE1 domain-containing protein [Terriglobia bacterium]
MKHRLLSGVLGNNPRDHLLSVAVYAIIYFAAYRYGMTFLSAHPSPIWFPDSVLLCALLLAPRATWWIYVLIPLPIRLFTSVPADTPTWFLFVCYVNDVLKGLLSAWILLRGADTWFTSVREFARYLLVAVALFPALSAFGGAVFLTTPFWPSWTQWFLGDALASLILTPALYCLARHISVPARLEIRRLVEAGVLLAGLVVCSFITFNLDWDDFANSAFLLYVPTPFLVWAGVRFGPLATSAGLFVMSSMATFGALNGAGPFASRPPGSAVLAIQLFLLVPSTVIMFLAVLRQQQHQTHAALRESEERFRLLVDTAPVMVWMSDKDGLCTFVNKPWLNFTGIPLEHHLGSGWMENINPEDRDRIFSESLSAFNEKKGLTLEYRLRRHDGVYRWILDSGIPRFGPDQTFLGFLGSCVDITHQKEAEDKLRRLPRELLNAQEAERQRIGQELHDDLGQRVVALSIGINSLSHEVMRSERIEARFADLRQQATEIVKDIARISHQLRPGVLQSLGLPTALESLCEKSRDPNGMNVIFAQHGEAPEHIPWLCSIALYRVAQEALRNALTHSGSDQVNVDLTTTSTTLVLEVSDYGRGFEPQGLKTGLGMSGMAERIA